jgi:hypothetical protein
MKIKLIILSLLASNFVYANNLKIISHEETHISWSEYKDAVKLMKTTTATCQASADPASGKAGDEISAFGNVSYSIYNDANDAQTYSIDEYMCINTFGCTHFRDYVTLDSHLSGSGEGVIGTKQYIETKGTYVDEATMQISGSSACFKQGSNTVTVN